MNKLIGSIKTTLALFLIHLFNCFPIKKNKIFFFSYYGSQYGCNPKYITEFILKNNEAKKYDLVWAFNNPDLIPEKHGIRKVKVMTVRYFYELCTSKGIITNFRTTELFIKRREQYYIQTWHSSLRLKQIEKDAVKSLPEQYVQIAKKDSLKCDLLLSGCKYSTDIFKRAFWYSGEIFEQGTPRNDLLIQNNKSIKRTVFSSLNIPINSKVILYAPTFRKGNQLDVYNLDYDKVLDQLRKKYGGEWTFLIKLHPHLLSKSSELVYGEGVMDVTAYDDIQELLSISDVLISDYSSLMFDFSLTKRPCFLYVPDLVDYTKNDRSLYFDINKLPFKTAVSNKELLHKIENFSSEEYQNDLSRFQKSVGSFENGEACKHVKEKLDEVCFNKKRRELHEAV
ncbi:CDP-glycerol glycerophosphotransferase family protein [Alkalihalobacillus sp. MEB130]|uniref:CDP-glycerol glycerophosphotransferase family protein n=1 Tax=Alkalihalobacillus sp. MEB130 TaxID=2976704 RepID=UPI0028DEF6BE|nr:CDP-glycerol glycerophosphotransferase family protein [Alkalihalobacillus sp. MEB130]MDT8861097.1 CDP-glycerol glycerophosphotransferase family protein [Alkalihalobacillus sp. MEB130]